LGRITASYDERILSNEKELELARTQLGDYQARLGRPFTHTGYMEELTGLRDRLKVSLSGTPVEGEPSAGELSEKIRALKDTQVIEAAPQRVREKKRDEIRRRVEQPREVAREPAQPIPEEPVKPDEDDAPRVSYRQVVKPKRAIQPRLL
jgi:hypothetical protein